MVSTLAPEAVLLAWQRLIRINLDSWKPEVAEWLHSDAAEPVLKELLVMVPCPPTLH